MRRVPSIVSLDATPINYDSVGAAYNHRPAGDGFVDRQKYALNRSSMHAADALVSWSDWAKRSLVEDYGVEPAKVRVIAPGAAPMYFEIGQRRQAKSAGRLRVLFVGGDFLRKGGDVLLEAARALGDRVHVDVVSNADVPAQSNVRVHRGVTANSPELLRLFEQADVFVLPSIADCLAVVLMEATAAGLPIITTDVGALGEAVVDGGSGLIVPTRDVKALKVGLERLAEDAPMREQMGRAGFDLAREKFDAEHNNRALLDLATEVARARQTITARRAA
jgi:glycosyltransferase involved in cell wall biosynthesis